MSGLVVEYIVAIDVTWVRFPADASRWVVADALWLKCEKKMDINVIGPHTAHIWRLGLSKQREGCCCPMAMLPLMP